MSATKTKRRCKVIRTPKGYRRLRLNEKRKKGDLFFNTYAAEWQEHWFLTWGVPVWRGDYPVIRKINAPKT